MNNRKEILETNHARAKAPYAFTGMHQKIFESRCNALSLHDAPSCIISFQCFPNPLRMWQPMLFFLIPPPLSEMIIQFTPTSKYTTSPVEI